MPKEQEAKLGGLFENQERDKIFDNLVKMPAQVETGHLFGGVEQPFSIFGMAVTEKPSD